MNRTDGTGGTDLWCVHLQPKRRKVGADLVRFCGHGVMLVDNRTPTFDTVRQRLALFTSRRAAARWARKHNAENEFWTANGAPGAIDE